MHQQVGSEAALLQDGHHSRSGGENLSDVNVEAHTLQLRHKLLSRGLSFISAET